jgi:hypothetical protein
VTWRAETMKHLLVSCVFSRQFWFSLLSLVGVQSLTITKIVFSVGW